MIYFPHFFPFKNQLVFFTARGFLRSEISKPLKCPWHLEVLRAHGRPASHSVRKEKFWSLEKEDGLALRPTWWVGAHPLRPLGLGEADFLLPANLKASSPLPSCPAAHSESCLCLRVGWEFNPLLSILQSTGQGQQSPGNRNLSSVCIF